TGGFTEFVPLSFIHSEAPIFAKGLVQGIRTGATGDEVVRMHAIARIMLHGHIDNVQVSWVKEGLKLAQICLDAGTNDLGGTLINESISTSAGAGFGQLVPPRELRRFVWDAGRVPVERTTGYEVRRTFVQEEDPVDPLDQVGDNPEGRFGSYQQLVASDRFRFAEGFRCGEGPPKKPGKARA
ncbi:MAG: 7,8-didemethyl-8-hydroxy-5-deazariboflavin synthase subunit CofH, partial [Myxococcota bacterium]|nr:7,8-didemethyl-8-hydroxy-5-deazariboflavin synthase subunit CofH [Myxococcota bacterium]